MRHWCHRLAAYRSAPCATDVPASLRTVLAGTDRARRRLSDDRIHAGGAVVSGLAPFLAGRDAEHSSGKHLASASRGVTWYIHQPSLVAVVHWDSCCSTAHTQHWLTGQYLQWATRRPDAKCWWCNYKTQTREHLFKNCPQWKSKQKALWAAVREETGWGKDRFKISELFADERCSKAILDFLATTEVRRTAGPPVADEEPGSEALKPL